MSKPSKISLSDEAALREFAFRYPAVHEDFPWGHRAIKVNKKVFTFLVADERGLSVSAKLPESGEAALTLPFAEPTGYGMGKAGWVTCQFRPDQPAPIEILQQFIDESYRAIAPKKLVQQVTGGATASNAAANRTSAARAGAATKLAPVGRKTAARKPASAGSTSTAAKPATRGSKVAAAKPASRGGVAKLAPRAQKTAAARPEPRGGKRAANRAGTSARTGGKQVSSRRG